jgi:hypothetical protein
MIRTLPLVRHRAPADIGVRQKAWSIIRVMLPTKPRGAGYTSASRPLISIALPGGGINVAFTSVGDIDAWKWKRVGLHMDDTSGRFALVMLRAKQVRVHHKRTKHEYVFRISDDRIEVAECLLHPNHAAPVDPRELREEAQAAAEWFVEKRSRVSTDVLDVQPRSGWVAAQP